MCLHVITANFEMSLSRRIQIEFALQESTDYTSNP